jgi:dienelactone hydrolase
MPTETNFKVSGADVKRFDPDGTPNGAVIIIGYGSDGMNPPWDKMIEGYADDLSKKGFTCMIPDYLAATNTAPGPGVFPLIEKLRPVWLQAISATIDYAKTLASVDSTRIGLLGFSLGGHLCLRVRAKARVLVEFFAPVFDGIGAAGTLTHAQIHHGKADKLRATTFPNAEAIRDTLNGEGTPTELCGYDDAGHGFIGPTTAGPHLDLGGTDAGNAKASTDSKVSTLSFFETHL